MAIVHTVRKYWLFCVLMGIICGWVILSGLLDLADSTATCHDWSPLVLDFTSYDMAPGDNACGMPKSGYANYADVKMINNVLDSVRVIIGAVMLWIGCSAIRDLAKKAYPSE
ncbi:hypothetical protein ACFWPK_16765 [Nocardia sp. NPDC058519]|uniref:hypothetical protein n=1 Tax=Nocardia sp. NPDC058519 TaxID=3346535 RepID=UPI003646E3F4